MAIKVGGQNFGYQLWFCTRLLMLATNFGKPCTKLMATKVGCQTFGYQLWFCTRLMSVTQLAYQVTMLSKKPIKDGIIRLQLAQLVVGMEY